MIPSGYEFEAAWKIWAGLLFAVLLGGCGVALLVSAVWQWFARQKAHHGAPRSSSTS